MNSSEGKKPKPNDTQSESPGSSPDRESMSETGQANRGRRLLKLKARLSSTRRNIWQAIQRSRRSAKQESKELQPEPQDAPLVQESIPENGGQNRHLLGLKEQSRSTPQVTGKIFLLFRDPRLRAILAAGFGLVIFVIITVMVLALWHELIQFEHKSSLLHRQDVLLLASYPRFLSTDDQGGVVITVVNTGSSPITATAVSLIYDNAKYVSMDVDESSLVRFGRLAPDERKTKLVKFQVNRIDSRKQKLNIDLNLSARDSVIMTNTVTNTLRIQPTVFALPPPIDVSALVLNRTFTVPNLLVALVAILVAVKPFMEIIEIYHKIRSPDSEQQSSTS
jgi:hypothetical protein